MRKAKAVGRWAGLAVAVAAVALAGSAATADINPDSTTWEGSFEGDVNPADAGWASHDGAADKTTVMEEDGTDFIKFKVTDETGMFVLEERIGTLDPKTNGGIAFEFRMRTHHVYPYLDVFCSDPAGRGGGGTYRFARFYTTTTNAYIEDITTGQSDIGNLNVPPAWTLFRVLGDDSSFQVFKDGSTEPHMEINNIGSNDARDGYMLRLIAVDNIDWDLDYLRWTDGESGGPGDTPGDANLDGVVDDADLSLLLANWQQDATNDPDGGWGRGEFDGAAPVEDADLSLLLSNWTVAGQVPEPASVLILVAGLAGAVLRRSRK